jgi:hypothetical protein
MSDRPHTNFSRLEDLQATLIEEIRKDYLYEYYLSIL